MENNKISINLSTAIIIAVIVTALIVGLVGVLIFNIVNKEDNKSFLRENDNTEQSIEHKTDDVETKEDDNSASDDKSNKADTGKVKSSSKTSPAKIGEWTMGSIYKDGEYIDVPVKVTNVTRGTAADNEYKDYCENSIYKYESPKKDLEYAIVEYQVDLTNMEEDDIFGYLHSSIRGTGDYTNVEYNGTIYILLTTDITRPFYKNRR